MPLSDLNVRIITTTARALQPVKEAKLPCGKKRNKIVPTWTVMLRKMKSHLEKGRVLMPRNDLIPLLVVAKWGLLGPNVKRWKGWSGNHPVHFSTQLRINILLMLSYFPDFYDFPFKSLCQVTKENTYRGEWCSSCLRFRYSECFISGQKQHIFSLGW